MKQVYLTLGLLAALALSLIHPAQAHCQIPCGIYDDHARVQAMLEDTATIDKAVRMLTELAGKTDAQSLNQQVRWVVNKEQHAEYVIRTISDYFLTQRVKPSQKDYAERLARHHAVMLAAMKAKQSANREAVEQLRQSIQALAGYYPKHEH